MKLKNLLCLALLLLTTYAIAGIHRHDVPEKKYEDLAKEKQFDCVGRVFNNRDKIGSCVLIGEQYVLSAGHVFISSQTRKDTIIVDGRQVVMYTPFNSHTIPAGQLFVELNGKKLQVKRLVIQPTYMDTASHGAFDIAILELEEAVTNIAPVKMNGNFDELNDEVTGVGYGASGPADKPQDVGIFDKKIAGENIIDSFAGKQLNGRETKMFCDFDHPTNTALSKTGSSKPQALEYICSGGDSGGGLFRKKDNVWQLIGICSGSSTNINELIKTGYYGQLMSWTRVSVFQDWIATETK